MSKPKWYKLKSKNSTAFAAHHLLPNPDPVAATEEEQLFRDSYMAIGPLEHCKAHKVRLEKLNYPGELYIEECEYNGRITPVMNSQGYYIDEEEFMNANKELIERAKVLLNHMGFSVKTGHMYELFSQLSGHKSWNVAKTKGANFAQLINKMTLQVGEYYASQSEEVHVHIKQVDGVFAFGLASIMGRQGLVELIWNSKTGWCMSPEELTGGVDCSLTHKLDDDEAIATFYPDSIAETAKP